MLKNYTGMISTCMQTHPNLNSVAMALESTSVFSIHIVSYLSTCEILIPFKPYVFCVNPKMTTNYRKSYVGMDKTNPLDTYLIADFARCGHLKKLEPWRGSQFLALKQLIRHRLHLAECITRKKHTWFPTSTWNLANCSSLMTNRSRSATFLVPHLLPYWQNICLHRKS